MKEKLLCQEKIVMAIYFTYFLTLATFFVSGDETWNAIFKLRISFFYRGPSVLFLFEVEINVKTEAGNIFSLKRRERCIGYFVPMFPFPVIKKMEHF